MLKCQCRQPNTTTMAGTLNLAFLLGHTIDTPRILTTLRTDNRRIFFYSRRGRKFAPSPRRPDRLWDSCSFLFSKCRRLFSWGVKAASVWSRPLHLVPRLGMIGAVPHMLSCSAKRQLRFALVGYVKQYISAFFVARLSTDEIFPSVQELQRFRRNSTRRDVWIQNNTTEQQLGNLVGSGLQYYDICKIRHTV